MTLLPLCDDQQENKRSGLPYPFLPFLATQAHRAAPIRSSLCASAVAPPGRSSLCASAAAPLAPCQRRSSSEPLLPVRQRSRSSGPVQAPMSLRPPASADAPPGPAVGAATPPTGGSPLDRAAPRVAGLQAGFPWPAPGAGRWGALAGPLAQAAGCLASALPRPATLRRPSWHPSRLPQMDPFQIPPE